MDGGVGGKRRSGLQSPDTMADERVGSQRGTGLQSSNAAADADAAATVDGGLESTRKVDEAFDSPNDASSASYLSSSTRFLNKEPQTGLR